MEGCGNISREELEESCRTLKQQMCRSENAGNPAQLVQFAECAAKRDHADIAVECLQLYFSLNPPVNQFLIRAHLCKALVASPLNCLERAKLLEAAQHIQTAVNIAVKFECYNFLVYNASVTLWKLCRPFQKPGYQRFCVKPLQNMVKALEEIGEEDYSWRIELIMGLVLGYLDAGLKEEATKTLSAAILLARRGVPDQLVSLLKFQMHHLLGDPKSLEKEVKASVELNTWNKLYRLMSSSQQHSLQTPELKQKLRALLTDVVPGTEHSSSGPQSFLSAQSQGMLLADLAELTKVQGYPDLATECANKMPSDQKHQVLRELITAEQTCMAQVLYTKEAVEIRLRAIKKTEEALTSATRIEDPDLVQRSCVVLWNLSLPLLQYNLRHHLLKPFRAATSALQNIDSLLHPLRCSLHFELAKVMADDNQLQSAYDHAQKALLFDYAGDYTEQLNHLQSRLALRAQLFDTPQNTLGKAAKIIEQIGSNPGLGDISALLIQAGDLLAPNCFLHIVSSYDVSGYGGELQMESGAKKLQIYEQAVQKVVDHAKVMGADSDSERCYLWSDLVKAACKASVWGVAFGAAKLCLVYDDGRWGGAPSTRKHSLQQRASTYNRAMSSAIDGAASNLQRMSPISNESKARLEKDLVRTLANIHCLHAKALIYLLQQDGLKLGVLPELRDKNWHGGKTPADVQDTHQKYCNWALTLTSDARRSFLKAAELGCSIREPWIVYNAATYLWNHSGHLIEGGKFVDLVEGLRALLPYIKEVQPQFNPELLSHISAALAQGIVQRWMPVVPEPSSDTNASSVKKKSGRGATPKKGKGIGDVQVDPEAGTHLKEALDVCEAAMNVAQSGVGLLVRWHVLTAWVQCKQLLQQPVPRDTLGHENQADQHLSHCRAIVAIEMIQRLGNGIWEFPNCPTLNEVYDLIKVTSPWEDRDIELELLTKVTAIAVTQKEYDIAMKFAEVALQLDSKDQSNPDQKTATHPSNTVVECESFSHVYCLLGQCLEATINGNHLQVEKAMDAYFRSARFGHQAKNYSLVIKACQHYWNACLPIACCLPDRAVLQDPLSQLLKFLEFFNAKKGHQSLSSQEEAAGSKDLSQSYSLQVAMYGLVFQIYFDKSLWKDGLKAIEEAMQRAPKDIHRHLMQHKLVFKSKVGKGVEAELVHFQDEPEEAMASLWYKVAMNTTAVQEQAKAFQQAIAALKSPVHSALKTKYLIEFGQWLYNHDQSPVEAIEQFQLAVGLLQQDMATSVLADTPPTSTEAVTPDDVTKLDSCMVVYAMMAQVEGGVASKKGLDNILLSLGCCMKMWKSTFGCLGNVGSSSSKGKSSGPSLPMTPQDWASFTLPDELKTLIKDGKSSAAINSSTILQPSLSVHYLGLLADDLSKASLHPLSIPVLILQLSITECIVECPPLVSLIHSRISAVCLTLGLKLAASHHNEKAALTMTAGDVARAQAEAVLFAAKRGGVIGETKEVGSTHPDQGFTAVDHTGVCSDNVPSREVWLQQAQLLTEQGQYQPARELLDEALYSCEMYGDRHTLGRVLLAQATLAVIEKNYQQASELLQKLQRLPVVATVWLEGVLLLSEVLSHNDLQQADTTVTHALSILSGRGRRSEAHFIKYAQAKLRAKYAILSISRLEGSQLLNQCQVLSNCADQLMELGHQYEATELCTIEANTLMCVGLTMKGKGHYKQVLLKALDSYRKSRNTLQILLDRAQSLCKPSEALSLPVQRWLVSSLLDEAHLLTIIFEDNTCIERDLWNKRRQKSSVEKLIDDFIRDEEGSGHCGEDQLWSDTSRCAREQAVSLLVSAHSLTTDEDIRSQCAYALGHFLLLLSEHTSPYGPLQWWEGHEAPTKMEGGGEHLSALSIVMRKEEAQREETCEALSLQYLAQASQSLAQAVTMALQCGNLEIAKDAAFRLVECFGCHDTASSSQYLALYQSCSVSLEFRRLLPLLHPNPYHTELGALLLQSTHIGSHPSLPPHTPTTDTNSHKLQQYECWKRTVVSNGHTDLLRSFPSHFRFIVLQHSPDKTRLYAAYLIPPQPPPPAPKKGQTPIPPEVIEPVTCCVSVAPQVLKSLMELVGDFKKELSDVLLKEQTSGTRPAQGSDGQDDQQTQSMCADIITATEEYLSEATSPISRVLQREGTDKKLVVVLLADTSLMQLPLEALTFLHSSNVLSVCRDFSLQMLHNRMAKFQSETGSAEEGTKDKKKVEKYISLPTTITADPANFKYILDPRNDAKSPSYDISPVLEIAETFQSFPKLTSKWTGLKGTAHIISSGEWPTLLRGCSGLIFFGYERFLAHFSAARLTSLNLSSCSVVLLMDQMQTKGSVLFQSREDLGKSDSELQLEQHLYSMIFLSLVGVGCVVANQWCCAVRTNLDFTKAVVKGLLSESKTIGELVWETRHHLEPDKTTPSVVTVPELEHTSEVNPPLAPPPPMENMTVKYGTVVYGLPHIALVAPTTPGAV